MNCLLFATAIEGLPRVEFQANSFDVVVLHLYLYLYLYSYLHLRATNLHHSSVTRQIALGKSSELVSWKRPVAKFEATATFPALRLARPKHRLCTLSTFSS